MTVRDRLKGFIKFKGLTSASFEKICGLGNGFVSKVGDSIRRDKLDKISNKFPELNVDWIINEKGSMLYSESGSNARRLDPDEGNGVMVRFFSVTPTATFQEFCSKMDENPEYLLMNNIDGEVIDESSCIFEIYGESMAPQIQNHSKVFCEEIPPTRWHHLNDCIVVIAYADRFVIKRIVKNRLDSENHLILASDNPDFPGKEIVQLSDIRCIYRARRIISQQIF